MKRQMPENPDANATFGNGGGMGGGARGVGDNGVKRYRNAEGGWQEALDQGKYEIRLLIPSKVSGAVIGRGGENIKAIREKYEAVLTLPDKNTPERVFTIVVAQDRLVDCLREVVGRLAEDLEKYANKKTQGEIEVRWLVHQSHAGAIIGRQGAKIKELREQTGALLKVFQECAPLSTDRVVLISAPQEKIPEVVATVADYLRDTPLKGPSKPYDAANYDVQSAYNYGGYAAEKMPPMGAMQGDGPPARGPGGGGAVYFGGPPRGVPGGYQNPPPAGYEDYEYERPSRGYGQAAYGGPQHYGGPRGGGGSSGIAAYGMGDNGGVTTTQVTIPNELGGTIIGKGGERINQIRNESGAKVEIGQNYGANERVISITGSPQQIQSAQFLLQQTVRSSEAGRRYLQQQHR
ncbi:KH domain protein [Aphelenchoides fujianensis]|nr:KH domain protein [Aphelenchoides fujianensis]